ncbi:MAG: site-specific DNA-methyltransferase [Desulfobacterales bacterium]|nr:site-specific DNA-methyltransferase [Desulfobacterales bacterium]
MEKRIRLYKGDCLIESEKIESGSVDLILTDLPYGTTACSWDEIIPFDELWNVIYRILRPNGFIVLTASQPFTSKLVSSNIKNFSHNWVWNKKRGTGHLLAKKRPMMASEDIVVFTNEHSHDFTFKSPLRAYTKKLFKSLDKKKKEIFADMGNQSVCHFMRTESTQFSLCTKKCYNSLIELYKINDLDFFIEYDKLKNENIEWLQSFPRTYNPQMRKREKARKSKMKSSYNTCYGDLGGYDGDILEKKYPINIIEFDKSGHNNMLHHPTQKPIELLEYLIKTFSNENDLVVDLTMGSGSTGVACVNTNRNFIGIELDNNYFEIAKKRILNGVTNE